MKRLALSLSLLVLTSCASAIAEPKGGVLDITQKQFDLGIALVKESTGESNRVVSPYSIHSGLMLARLGAKDDTAQQLDEVLISSGLTPESLKAYGELNSQVVADSPTSSVSLANSVWISNKGSFLAEYLGNAAQTFAAETRTIDFEQPEAARKTINAWVSEKTKSLIPNLIPAGVIRVDTLATLVNALYFKSAWATPFSKDMTIDKEFWIGGSRSIKVPTMQITTSMGYHQNAEWTSVVLPYDMGRYAYVLAVPTNKLSTSAVASALTPTLFKQALDSQKRVRVDLEMPRYSARESQALANNLKKLGVRKPFEHDANFLDMTEMPVFIGAVQHESVVIVDEEGTEAAAATAVIMTKRSAFFDDSAPKVVKADRPFAFAIVHTDSLAPLFVGVVGDPTAK
jgi:serpin B